ncbi:MAG: hypothetical protein HY401_04270 [Elusimicrobia bacterium]|nr:hypothetical protein [Elusimicrobiota bacterium]
MNFELQEPKEMTPDERLGRVIELLAASCVRTIQNRKGLPLSEEPRPLDSRAEGR